jgi:hypothetical protein
MLICFLDVRDKMGDSGMEKPGISDARITASNASGKYIQTTNTTGSRDSSVGIATGYGLDDQEEGGVRVQVG